MIPLKLQLKNFLSYGQAVQTINFEPYQLICLSGKNGHGKSALLDALSWLVWGQARKVGGAARADETLIRLGQSHMFVLGEFLSNGIVYKIRREITLQNSKTVTVLDFAVVDSTTGVLRNLTDKTIRATQEKIINTLGFDFDTFSNSVFLRQGQSHEFSKKTPKERKDILASILGLQRFEQIKQQALEALKKFTQEQESCLQHKKIILESLAQKPQILTDYQEVISLITTKQAHQQIRENQKKALIHHIHEQKEKIYKLKTIQQKQRELLEHQRTTQEVYSKQVARWREQQYKLFHAQHLDLNQEALILEKITQFEQVKQKQLELQNSLGHVQLHRQKQLFQLQEEHHQRLRAQENKHADHQRIITDMNSDLLREQAYAASLGFKIEEQRQQLTLLQEKTSALEQLKSSLDQAQQQKELRQKNTHRVNMHTQRLEQKLKDLEHKQTMCTQVTAYCLLCEQSLSDTHQKTLLVKFEQENKLIDHQQKRLKLLQEKLQRLAKDHESTLDKLQHALIEHQQAQASALIIKENSDKLAHEQSIAHEKITKLTSQLPPLTMQLSTISTQLEALKITRFEHDPKMQEYHKHALEIQQQLQELSYDQEHLACLYQQKKALEQYKETQRQLEYIRLQSPDIRKAIQETATQLRALKNLLTFYAQEIAQLTHVEHEASKLEQQEYAITQELQNLNQELNNYLIKKGALEQQLRTIELAEIRLRDREQELERLSQEIRDYQLIAQAVSKDGIPALLIEQALPELEHEANYLLARLTDNQTQLTIESLRDLKSGATRETLDIKISDSLGIRSYDLFSGGEAFRIDLALRIALSKLLARRSGTALQTLIIDEGFGSQDEEGLSRIMDALYKIQDDFAKIIIVSHLPIMKDQFPTHFVIHKTPTGSTVQVMLQG